MSATATPICVLCWRHIKLVPWRQTHYKSGRKKKKRKKNYCLYHTTFAAPGNLLFVGHVAVVFFVNLLGICCVCCWLFSQHRTKKQGTCLIRFLNHSWWSPCAMNTQVSSSVRGETKEINESRNRVVRTPPLGKKYIYIKVKRKQNDLRPCFFVAQRRTDTEGTTADTPRGT